MPDPTYKTFLSPGSCQLEVTDLVATANDDTGVDLYGVAWEIEQVIMAGEGFAASPTDVWVNERGILNVGQSLFDKINRTALNNTNIPGQCTVIVKATSLVDSSKVARLKVLVGYPGEDQGYLKPTGTISITENGENIDVAQYAKANVNVSGGGGDFSTATVTFARAEGFLASMSLDCAMCAVDAESMLEATSTKMYSEESSAEFTAVLYKGKALAYPSMDDVTVTVTGNVTYDSDLEMYVITGDCTFTFADL